jgi:hypothetical protein
MCKSLWKCRKYVTMFIYEYINQGLTRSGGGRRRSRRRRRRRRRRERKNEEIQIQKRRTYKEYIGKRWKCKRQGNG